MADAVTKIADTLTTIAYVPYGQSSPCFALPLFGTLNSKIKFVQEIDEVSNKICSFKKIEDQKGAEIPIEFSTNAAIGDEIIYIFVSEEKTPVVGKLRDIRATLESFLNHRQGHDAIRLQILELLGTDSDKRTARSRMCENIARKSGRETATSFYAGSVLRSALWDKLLSGAVSESAARRILAARSKIGVVIRNDGEFELDISCINPEDHRFKDASVLHKELEAEFDSSAHRKGGTSSSSSLLSAKATVKWFNSTKGYGFVTLEKGGDAFLHASALGSLGLDAVTEGALVVCDLQESPRGMQVVTVYSVDTSTAIVRTRNRSRAVAIDGRLKFFDERKGFGFVSPNEGGRDLYISAPILHHAGIAKIEPGQPVRVWTQSGPKGREITRIECTGSLNKPSEEAK